MIEINGVNHFYGKFQALFDINFAIPKGQIAGFIGPNGAGKSTTLKILTGYLVPTEGEVFIDGVSLKKEPIEARCRLGYMPETPLLYKEMRISEYLHFVAKLKGLSKQDACRQIDDLFIKCGLVHIQKMLIGNLSKGNRQRVAFAQALLGRPKALFLDEPMSAMDPAQTIAIRQLIREIASETTVLMSSHVLSEITQLCDHVIFIKAGRVQYKGDVSMVSNLIETGFKAYELVFKESAEKWMDMIQALPELESIEKRHGCDNILAVKIKDEGPFFPALFKAAADERMPLREINSMDNNLESLFKDFKA